MTSRRLIPPDLSARDARKPGCVVRMVGFGGGGVDASGGRPLVPSSGRPLAD